MDAEIEAYGRQIRSLLARICASLEGLSEAQLTWRPPIDGANSAYVIAAHTLGNARAWVLGITLGLTLIAFIATAALRATDAPEALRWFTPFEHYHSAEAMSGDGLPLLPLVLLPSMALAASAVAVYWYERRDIAI